MKQKLISVLGWYGVVAILTAYTLMSFEILSSKDIIYLLLNLTGSVGIIIVAWSRKDAQPMVLNVVWAAVALLSLVNVVIKT